MPLKRWLFSVIYVYYIQDITSPAIGGNMSGKPEETADTIAEAIIARLEAIESAIGGFIGKSDDSSGNDAGNANSGATPIISEEQTRETPEEPRKPTESHWFFGKRNKRG